MGKLYEATVDWIEGDAFRALGPSGHAVVFDGAAPDGVAHYRDLMAVR